MKALLYIAICLFSAQLGAQNLRISPYGGYAFKVPVDSYHSTENYYEAFISASSKYGIDAEYEMDPYFSAGVSALHQNTALPVTFHINGLLQQQDLRIRLDWILIGGSSHLQLKRLELLLGAKAGIGILQVYAPSYPLQTTTKTRFAWSIRTGVVYFPIRKVGVSFLADGLCSFHHLQNTFVSSPSDLGKHISAYNWIFQLSFTSGLVIRIGNKGLPEVK